MKNPAIDFAQITVKRTLLLKLDYENLIAYMQREPDLFSEDEKNAIMSVYTTLCRNYFSLIRLKDKK